MARGKTLSNRPSTNTQRQILDPSEDPVQPEPIVKPVLTRVVTQGDARTMIDLNQYKYTNVLGAAEHMANLTGNELAEAIRLYRERQL